MRTATPARASTPSTRTTSAATVCAFSPGEPFIRITPHGLTEAKGACSVACVHRALARRTDTPASLAPSVFGTRSRCSASISQRSCADGPEGPTDYHWGARWRPGAVLIPARFVRESHPCGLPSSLSNPRDASTAPRGDPRGAPLPCPSDRRRKRACDRGSGPTCSSRGAPAIRSGARARRVPGHAHVLSHTYTMPIGETAATSPAAATPATLLDVGHRVRRDNIASSRSSSRNAVSTSSIAT